jgi:hypothetical protein
MIAAVTLRPPYLISQQVLQRASRRSINLGEQAEA